MKRYLWIMAALYAPCSLAETVHCRADFDESSFYEVTIEKTGGSWRSPIQLRYVTEDGLDLHVSMNPKRVSVEPGQEILAEGESESMKLALRAPYQDGNRYEGDFELSFNLDHASPVQLRGACSLN